LCEYYTNKNEKHNAFRITSIMGRKKLLYIINYNINQCFRGTSQHDITTNKQMCRTIIQTLNSDCKNDKPQKHHEIIF